MVPSEVMQSPDITTGQAPSRAGPVTAVATCAYRTARRSHTPAAGRSALTTLAGVTGRSRPGEVVIEVIGNGDDEHAATLPSRPAASSWAAWWSPAA